MMGIKNQPTHQPGGRRPDDQEPKFPLGQAFIAAIIMKAEVPGMDHRVGLHVHGQVVAKAELTVGIADQQESHANVFHASSGVPVP